MSASFSTLADLEQRVNAAISAGNTLALDGLDLLDTSGAALFQSFLPNYQALIQHVEVKAGDSKLIIRGDTALPFASSLKAELTLSLLAGKPQLALQLTAAEPIDLGACLNYFAPGVEALPSALSISALEIAFDSQTHAARAALALTGAWSVELGASQLALQEVKLELEHMEGHNSVAIHATADVAGVALTLSAAPDESGQLCFSAQTGSEPAIDLRSTLALMLPSGVSVPAELPELSLSDLKLAIAPRAKTFSFSAHSSASFELGLGMPGLQVGAALEVTRAEAGGAVSARIAVSAPGPFPVLDALSLHDIDLAFVYSAGESWSLEGGLAAELFEHRVALHAKLEDSAEERSVELSGELDPDTQIVSFGEHGALHASQLMLRVTRSKAAAVSSTSWQLSASAGLRIDPVLNSSGTLELYHDAQSGRAGLLFKSDTAHANIQIPVAQVDPAPSIDLALQQIAIVRAANSSAPRSDWSLQIAAHAGFVGWPSLAAKLLPAEGIDATLDVDASGLRLGISGFSHALDLPVLSIAGKDYALGAAAIEASHFEIEVGQHNQLGFELGIGLPSNINYMFGERDGKPALELFRSYSPGDATSLTRMQVRINTQGISANLTTSPISERFIAVEMKAGTAWWNVDLGDYGAVSLMAPVLEYDGLGFSARGGFEIVRPLGLPLAPLQHLLQACGLQAVAQHVPGALMLNDSRLSLRQVLNDLRQSHTVLTKPIDAIEQAIDLLPERLTSYLELTTPERLDFEIEVRDGGSVRFDIATDPEHPIRVMLPVLNPIDPMLLGVELRRASLGELFGGALAELQLDGRVDMFDLLPLTAALALDALGKDDQRPDTKTLGRSLIIDNFQLALAYQAGIPVPVLTFFDELALLQIGAEGVELESRWRFPRPELSLALVRDIVREFGAFFSTAAGRLDENGPLADVLKLSIGTNYLRLPKYLSGATLGHPHGDVAEISAYRELAKLLNGLKEAGLSVLIEHIPLAMRNGSEPVAIGPLHASTQWLVTTPREFRDKSHSVLAQASEDVERTLQVLPAALGQQHGVITLMTGSARFAGAALDTRVALAATDAGFVTYMQAGGRLGNAVELDLRGSIRAPAEHSAFQLDAAGTLSMLGHRILHSALAVDGTGFRLDGQLDLLPGTPLEVVGNFAGTFTRDEFLLKGNARVNIGSWFRIAEASGSIDSSGLRLHGACLGALTAEIQAYTDSDGSWLAQLDVADAFRAQLRRAADAHSTPPPSAAVRAAIAEVDRANQQLLALRAQATALTQQLAKLRSSIGQLFANARAIDALEAQLTALRAAEQSAGLSLGAAMQTLATAQSAPQPQEADGAGPHLTTWTSDTISAHAELRAGWITAIAQASASELEELAVAAKDRLGRLMDDAQAADAVVEGFVSKVEARTKSLNEALQPGVDAVSKAQRDVDDFDRQIEASNAKWKAAFDKYTRDAQPYRDYQARRDELEAGIADAYKHQNIVVATSLELQLGELVLDNAYKQAVANFTTLIFPVAEELPGLQGLRRGAAKVLSAAQKALDGMRAGLSTLEAELKDLNNSLDQAKLFQSSARALSDGAQIGLGGLAQLANYIAKPGAAALLQLEAASFDGSLDQLHGGVVRLSVTGSVFGGSTQRCEIMFDFANPVDCARALAKLFAPGSALLTQYLPMAA